MKSHSNKLVISGLGASGSSALCDLLKEIKWYYVMPIEFRLFTDPDGIISLENSLVDNWTIFQSDLAIKRFHQLAIRLNRKFSSPYYGDSQPKIIEDSIYQPLNKYLNRLLDFRYKGMWVGIKSIHSILMIKLYKQLSLPRSMLKDIFVSKVMSREEFIEHTCEFVNGFINLCLKKSNKRHFVFDEGYASMNPLKVLKYVPHGKMIIVIRDPRDVYCESRKWLFLPDSVEDFIKFQKNLYKRLAAQTNNMNSTRLLIIKFEDLVLKYNNTVRCIFKFLNINPDDHYKKNCYFLPEESKKNVGLWKINPNYEDIKKIYIPYSPY